MDAQQAKETADQGVFTRSSFAIVKSPTLTESLAKEIEAQIRLHGGEVIHDEYPEQRLDLSKVTHIISTTTDFPDYYDAIEQFKHVVKPSYIPECVAGDRLTHPRRFSPDQNLIMSDVVAMCVDLPPGDKDAIVGGILAMGGNFSPKLTTQVTHVVALNTDNDTYEAILVNELDARVILPHWFDQCLRLGKRISEEPYLLPGADLTLRPGEAPVSVKNNKHIQGASKSTPTEQDLPEDADRRTLRVFKNRKVLLDEDLDLSPSLRNILTNIIQASSGKVVEKVSTANMVICKYREGNNYVSATLKKVDVGSLSWLYFLIVHDVWTSPFKRLLHYPLPKQTLPGFEKLVISVSNYNGEARTYLENLIEATGATRTKTLKTNNTHLITAHSQSEKVEAAEEWNIVCVNHLWIEESFAMWEMQSVTKSRYTQFPHKTHLGEVVGQTEVDRDVIMSKFIPSNTDTAAPHPQSIASSSSVLDAATSTKANAKTKTKSTSNKAASGLVTPSVSRVTNLDKENVTPATGSSRKSKAAAAAKLHDMADDIALFEKEKKRVGGVTHGGRRKADEDRVDVSRKRSAEPDALEPPQSSGKRQRTSSVSIHVRLLVSGHKAWVGKQKKENEDIKKLRELGIEVVTEADQATHVAVPQILRTIKFLTAIAFAPVVLSTEYIEACLEEGKYLDPKHFVLADKKYEQQHSFSLARTLKNATQNERLLFSGMNLYSVERLNPDFKNLDAVTRANGGQLTVYRGRQLGALATEHDHEDDDDDDARPEDGSDTNHVFLLSDGTAENRRLWPKFRKAVTERNMKPHVVLPEWLLSSALRQELTPIDEYIIKDEK